MTEKLVFKNFERLILDECFACIYVYTTRVFDAWGDRNRTRVRGGCVLCGSWELNP